MEPYILERSEHLVSRRDIDRNVLKVLYRLLDAGFVAYLVGGAVRDLMLGRRPKDFDVGTSAHPHQVRELFRNSRLIGRRFRLVHVFFGPQNIEVATFRRRSEPEQADGDLLIHHDNTFGSPEEDALRRDFTINALFYDPRSFRVIDFVGGCADVNARLIRAVGDPDVRMREDPVRMMRAVRFAAKLDLEIEPATRAAIERHRELLPRSSTPRLVEEFYRTFGTKGAARALELAEQTGLLEILLPPLSRHLRSGVASLGASKSARNLAALAGELDNGATSSHPLTLACMLLDLYLRLSGRTTEGGERAELLGELKARGFARGDIEQTRLLLEAFPRLLAPDRRTRSLTRRPHFAAARRLHAMLAPNYGADPSALDRFLAAPDGRAAEHPAQHSSDVEGPARRRRRRRRHGRNRRAPARGATASGRFRVKR